MAALGAGDADTIAITRGADSVILGKHAPSAWTVNGFAAGQSAVDTLLEALRDSVRVELVAQSPSSFARMGVDSAGGRLVRVGGGAKTLALFIVGAQGPEYDASYVRRPGDAHIYLWSGRLPMLVARGVDQWRDHQIAAVAPESIGTVEIGRGRLRYTVHKQGATWALTGARSADSAAVGRLIQRFRTVSASGFATARQTDSLRFTRPQRRVTVRDAQGRELLALAFDSAATGFWVRRPSGGAVYRMDTWQVDQLTPRDSTLLPKAAHTK